MISKNEAKYIQSLHDKKTRDEQRLFIAEGPKLINELIAAGIAIQKIYATETWAAENNHEAVIVTADELKKISSLQTPNQVLAVVQQPTMPEGPVLKDTLTLVLDGIQDPGNLGTIIRIADWFSINQIVAAADTVDKYNSKVVQSTMGSLIRVHVWYKDLQQWLDNVPVKIYGALLNGENVFTTGKIKEGILVIGNESKGIRPNILPYIQQPLTIPGNGQAESLNAAVATGIILSHIV